MQLTSGLNQVQVEFEINNPELWWTNGLGEAHLYKITSHLKIANVSCDEKSTNFGIRTIKVVRKKDETGTSFYFELNGVPVFAKGVNYIPNDNFLPRVSKKRYKEVIQSAVDANLNMLRVWGGEEFTRTIFFMICAINME